MGWAHRDRVLAALNHEEPDRVPMDLGGAEFTSITYPAYENLKRHLGLSHETRIMSVIHSVVHPDEDVLGRFDIDTRCLLPGDYEGGVQKWVDENCYIDIFGVTWKRSVGTDDIHFLHVDGPFTDIEPDIDAIENFEWPDPDNPGLVKGLGERIAEIKALGDYAICLYLPGGVIHRGYAMRGFETFLKDLYKNPEFVGRMMEKLADYWVGVAEKVIEAAGPENIDVVYFGEDLGTQNGAMFDPQAIYARYLKPHHRRMVETVKADTNAKVCFHCCGAAYFFVDQLIEIGVDALNPVQVTAKNMEPERLKDEFGGRMSFWGGINTQRIMPYGTTDEVRRETRRIIDILGKDGGYILNTVHNIQPEVPPENVVAMYDEGCNYAYRK
ncbi:MAG: uroporphyrinogen decarboxylase family protein [Rhodospirillales bacterium]|nr:uroporphyrinogen decarboxylase family protein [Rhodospirillales bacterium]